MKVNIRNFNKGNTERRIDVQVDKWDTYSLDHTVALLVLPMLLQLKHTKQGVPSSFTNDITDNYAGQFCFDFIDDDRNDVFAHGCKAWDDTLDKMIWAFYQLVDDSYDSKYHHGKPKYSWKKTDTQYKNPITGQMETLSELVDENPDEHWYDHVGHTLHEQRIQEGLELFGKHFRDLWD